MGNNDGSVGCCIILIAIAVIGGIIYAITNFIIPALPRIASTASLVGTILLIVILIGGGILGVGAGIFAYAKSFKRHMIDDNSSDNQMISHKILIVLVIAAIATCLILLGVLLITSPSLVPHVLHDVFHIPI